ncbi:MAG: recombination protein O N-terminal domain-containing protein [Treponema sp.]|jgi:DNA repair protein RecO (recombination protein O)|nr:recombination protein O N-terminal domain-containing protein [Treponema sp.]
MVRSFVCTALVLRVRPSGESNRDVWFLGAGEGVLRATVFGGPKSRLRSHVAPFHRGRLWFYHDPVRDSRKVTDFDVEAWRPGIRESYERTMAADAVAETILTSQGGGGAWEESFRLGDRTLSALEEAGEPDCLPVFLRFLWEWTDILGSRPEFHCAACGKDFATGGEAAAVKEAGESLWYSPREGGFLCAACNGISGGDAAGPEAGGLLPLGPGARRWLAAVGTPGPLLDPASLRELRATLTGMVARILGRRPGTWDLV